MAKRKEQTEVAEQNPDVATHTREPGDEPARQYAADPFPIETIKAGENKVHVSNSRRNKGFVIHFENNPNEGRGQGDPHPVLQVLKDAGFRWSRVGTGMAWKRPYRDGMFSYAEEQQARTAGRDAAESLAPGAGREQTPF